MMKMLKILLAAVAVVLTYGCITARSPQISPAPTEKPSTMAPTSQPTVVPDPSPEMILTDENYEHILSEQEIEMIIMDLGNKYPISQPDVTVTADEKVEISLQMDLNKDLPGQPRPAYMDKIAKMVKGTVPLYVKGKLIMREGKLAFLPDEAKMGGISLTALERIAGVSLMNNSTLSVDKIINDTVTAALKAKVETITYGDGFLHLKGKRCITAAQTPPTEETVPPELIVDVPNVG